jgi:hypothetical protein
MPATRKLSAPAGQSSIALWYRMGVGDGCDRPAVVEIRRKSSTDTIVQ